MDLARKYQLRTLGTAISRGHQSRAKVEPLAVQGECLHFSVILRPQVLTRNPSCSGPQPVYQDLSTRHDWPVKKAVVELPIRLKGNSKRSSHDWLSPLGVQNKESLADVTSRAYITSANVCDAVCRCNLVPGAFPTHFLREKPWGRG